MDTKKVVISSPWTQKGGEQHGHTPREVSGPRLRQPSAPCTGRRRGRYRGSGGWSEAVEFRGFCERGTLPRLFHGGSGANQGCTDAFECYLPQLQYVETA